VCCSKHAFESLGENGCELFLRYRRTREPQFESPLAEDAIMIEAKDENNHFDNGQDKNPDSSREKIVLNDTSYDCQTHKGLDHQSSEAFPSTPSPLCLPERKRKIVEWLCHNIHHLNELSQLPFVSPELLRLHHHFFTPSIQNNLCEEEDLLFNRADGVSNSTTSNQQVDAIYSEPFIMSQSVHSYEEQIRISEPTLNASQQYASGYAGALPMLKRKVSYRFLSDTTLPSKTVNDSTSRKENGGSVSKLIADVSGNSMQPKSKRARRNRTRISFVPRIKEKLDSFLETDHLKALNFMRQLQFVEKSLLSNMIYEYPSEDLNSNDYLAGIIAADAEMILLDMI